MPNPSKAIPTSLPKEYLEKPLGYAYSRTLAPLILFFALLAASRTIELPWMIALFVFLVGFAQYQLYFPLHDCAHYSLFRTTFENRLLGRLLAGLLFVPFDNFRDEHMQHHRAYGSLADPGSTDYWIRFKSRAQMALFLISPLWGSTVMSKIRDFYGTFAKPRPATGTPVRPFEGLLRLAVPGFIQLGVFWLLTDGGTRLWAYLAFSFLPGLTVFLFLSRLRMFLEHGSLDYKELDYLKAPRPMARTIPSYFPEKIMLSAMNFNFHHEHHLFPQVPSYQLPRVYREFTAAQIDPVSFNPSYGGSLIKLWRSLGRKR